MSLMVSILLRARHFTKTFRILSPPLGGLFVEAANYKILTNSDNYDVIEYSTGCTAVSYTHLDVYKRQAEH